MKTLLFLAFVALCYVLVFAAAFVTFWLFGEQHDPENEQKPRPLFAPAP